MGSISSGGRSPRCNDRSEEDKDIGSYDKEEGGDKFGAVEALKSWGLFDDQSFLICRLVRCKCELENARCVFIGVSKDPFFVQLANLILTLIYCRYILTYPTIRSYYSSAILLNNRKQQNAIFITYGPSPQTSSNDLLLLLPLNNNPLLSTSRNSMHV